MRWKKNKIYEPWEHTPDMPEEGATREHVLFAFFPIEGRDRTVYWWETVKVTEVFGKCYFGIRGCYTWDWKITDVETVK
jgi:hypothetical protein